jgi:hypothetical protein
MSTLSVRHRVGRVAVASAVLALAAACGGTSPGGSVAPAERAAQDRETATRIEGATLRPGQPVPRPKDPVLTVTGKISETNDGDALALGTDTLDRLGVLEVRLYEPWAKKRMSFRGVWLADLLEVAGAAPSARGVHMTALDDYEVDLTAEEIGAGGIFVATKAGDGSAIPVDEGGPTRIVFVDGVKAGKNSARWIWSLRDIDVR